MSSEVGTYAKSSFIKQKQHFQKILGNCLSQRLFFKMYTNFTGIKPEIFEVTARAKYTSIELS